MFASVLLVSFRIWMFCSSYFFFMILLKSLISPWLHYLYLFLNSVGGCWQLSCWWWSFFLLCLSYSVWFGEFLCPVCSLFPFFIILINLYIIKVEYWFSLLFLSVYRDNTTTCTFMLGLCGWWWSLPSLILNFFVFYIGDLCSLSCKVWKERKVELK